MFDLISMLYNSSWRVVSLSSFYIQGLGATERLSDFFEVTQGHVQSQDFSPGLFSAELDASATTPCRLSLATSVAELKLKLPVPELSAAPGEVQRWGAEGGPSRESYSPFNRD